MTEFVRLEVDGGVGVVRLDRPPMNAISRQVQEELVVVAAEAANRADVRAVVVYGGEKVLAAGADVKEMAKMAYADMAAVARRVSAGFGAMATIPKPTVAAITGYALGGGLELALGCDRRIAGDNAKLGQPEILLGVIPGGGGTQRLARLVGPSRAKDLILTGRMVAAEEALAIGLVNELLDTPDALMERARALARQMAAQAPLTMRAGKEVVRRMRERFAAVDDQDLIALCYGSADFREGLDAFLAKRPPRFAGK